jgi:DNA polymerase III alpha subunit
MSNLLFEDLSDRRIWVDGESTLNKSSLYNLILSGDSIDDAYIHDNDSEIKNYEKLRGVTLKKKQIPNTAFDTSFQIPTKYFNINLEKYFISKLKERVPNFHSLSEEEKELRIRRILIELEKYKECFLNDVLRLAIYIVDTFKQEQIVWGPGRGSSCCSYLLYLCELHDVDSVRFNLPIDEFLRET